MIEVQSEVLDSHNQSDHINTSVSSQSPLPSRKGYVAIWNPVSPLVRCNSLSLHKRLSAKEPLPDFLEFQADNTSQEPVELSLGVAFPGMVYVSLWERTKKKKRKTTNKRFIKGNF